MQTTDTTTASKTETVFHVGNQRISNPALFNWKAWKHESPCDMELLRSVVVQKFCRECMAGTPGAFTVYLYELPDEEADKDTPENALLHVYECEKGRR